MNTNSKTVEKTLEIIDYILKKNAPTGILEIAKSLDMNTSTVQRIVNTLSNAQYLSQDSENRKYCLGFKFLEISNHILNTMDLRVIAHTYLKELRDKTQETIHLMVLNDSMGVYIDSLESPQRTRVVTAIGTRDHLHYSAVGKAILAHLSDQEVETICQARGLRKVTSNTITDLNRLKRELSEVRRQGYSIDDEEGETGTRCIGAPIFKHNGKVNASISLAAPCQRLSREQFGQYVPLVIKTANKISAALGYIK